MLAAWMVYAMVVSLLLGLAALSGERVLSLLGRPLRWVWPAALALALGLSVGPWILPFGGEVDGRSAAAGSEGVEGSMPVRLLPSIAIDPEGGLARLDRPLAWSWAGGVAGLLAWLGASGLALRRRERDWTGTRVGDRRVLVSRDVGPAILGVFQNRVVLPRWCLELPHPAVELVVAHEEEHQTAGDTRWLLPMGAAAFFLPWNLPFWWMLRRYRQAAEVDCDARVLRRFPERRRLYGELLLLVCSRGVAPSRALVTFAESGSTLGRRIQMLTQVSRERQIRRAAVLSVVGGLLIVVACLVPGPDRDVPGVTEPDVVASVGEDRRATLSQAPTFTPYEVEPEILNAAQVREALQREYPSLLRDAGIGGVVLVFFFIDEDGIVRTAQVQQSSGHAALDAAAERVAYTFRFSPAMNRDAAVPVWVQIPIRFQVPGG